MEVVLPHAVKNFLKPSQPAEGLFCYHQVGFWPIFFDLFWGIQSLTFWSLGNKISNCEACVLLHHHI
jgi:hypothetical protein